MTKRLIAAWLLLACAPMAPAAAQALPDPNVAYVVVLQPREWMGEGTRGIVRGRAVRVEGLAHHASGIRQVSINGAPATLRRDRSGAMRFTTRVAAAALEQDVEIVAYPVEGEPVARIHSPDGTVRSGPLSQVRPPVTPIAAAEVSSPLRVSLQALPEAVRQVVGASLAATPGVAAVAPGMPAHLTLAGDGASIVVLGRDGSVRHRVDAPSPEEGAAGLVPVLAQELGALQLETLLAPRETFPLELAFVSGNGAFRAGQGIEFRAAAGRAGYFTLLDLGTDGTVAVLFPTEVDDPQVGARQPVLIPSAELRAQFAPDAPYQAAEPFGRGVVRAFVTPRPLEFTVNADGTVPAEPVLRALQAATTDPATGRTLTWATALLEYRITP